MIPCYLNSVHSTGKTEGLRWVTRFAPSPTGYLHLGHVASAAFVFGIGRALGAKIILRIEDHDRGRSRREFEDAVHSDLAWLGLEADAVSRQSDDWGFYEAELERLGRKTQVYACDCTRKRLLDAGESSGAELHYDGHCRDRHLAYAAGVGLRVVTPSGEQAFVDGRLGPLRQNPASQCGDLLLKDRDGHYTYQFAVTADDVREGVNLVIRGQDLTASTGRQIWLGGVLGRAEPARFYHHPLLTDPEGRKLGKRFFSESVASRRERQESASDVLGEALVGAGVINAKRPVTGKDLTALFLDDPFVREATRG